MILEQNLEMKVSILSEPVLSVVLFGLHHLATPQLTSERPHLGLCEARRKWRNGRGSAAVVQQTCMFAAPSSTSSTRPRRNILQVFKRIIQSIFRSIVIRTLQSWRKDKSNNLYRATNHHHTVTWWCASVLLTPRHVLHSGNIEAWLWRDCRSVRSQLTNDMLYDMVVSINGVPSKWMVFHGKSYENGWFGGIPISGNLHAPMYCLCHVGYRTTTVDPCGSSKGPWSAWYVPGTGSAAAIAPGGRLKTRPGSNCRTNKALGSHVD